jgi:hypothetical protein
MTKLPGNRLSVLLLAAVSLTSVCSAIASSDPAAALDFKPVFVESVVNIENRKSRTLKSNVSRSYANYFNYRSTPVLHPLPLSSIGFPSAHPDSYSTPDTTSYNNLDEYLSSFYYKKPKVAEKYSSKLKNLMPYIKSRGNAADIASRIWQNIPSRHEIVDRTIGAITSKLTAIGLIFLSPIILVTAVLFVAFAGILFLFPAVSAFGRRRVGRDLSAENLNQVFDFERFLPPEQSARTLASFAARLDSVLDTYMNSYKNDSCLERYSCEAGQMTRRWGKFTEPIIT